MSKKIRENSFDGAPGGSAGSINLQPSLGTHASPGNYQDPAKFHSSDYNKYYNKDTTGQPDTQVGDRSGSLAKDVDRLFNLKEKPTIDDIMCGIQYELQNMVTKDKRIAKERVIDNLKKHGAKFYTKLGMLNINDKNMDVTPVMQERIDVLNQMVAEKQSKRADFKLNDAIQNILQEKRDQKSYRADELLKKPHK